MTGVSVSCFFCEDLRREADGRCSAIGLYPVLGQTDDFPMELDRFRLVTYVSVPQSLAHCTVTVQLTLKNVQSEQRLKDSLTEEVSRDENLNHHPYWQIINDYDLGPITFEKDGFIQAVVSAGSAKSSCRLDFVDFAVAPPQEEEEFAASTVQ